MTVRNYRGIESLKEVECSGNTLPNEVKFLSLTLYKKYKTPQNSIWKEFTLASLETSPENACITYGEFSSCVIDDSDRRNSVVKTLISNLKGGERTIIGCNVSAVFKFVSGSKKMFYQTWDIEVYRESKFVLE